MRPAGQPDTTPPGTTAPAPAQARADAPEPMARGLLLAVDGTGLLVRCSRATRRRGLDAVGTLAMFAGSIARKLRVTRPSHVVVAWDGVGASGWRRRLWPPYKEDRPGYLDLGEEIILGREFCAAAGMHQLWLGGFEADDILAAITRSAVVELPGHQVLLASDDDDMLQLLGAQVSLTGLTEDSVTTANDVMDRWGVAPRDLPKLRALAGDASDNIPGLPGIGPKRAARLVRKWDGQWPPPIEALPDPAQRETVVLWADIMDLANPPHNPEGFLGVDRLPLGEQARWDPVAAGNVRELLDRYGMDRIAARLEKGVLW